VNLLEIKLSTAGIAAFLMLIGYSVDTDILLSTRVLKVTEGTVFEKIKGAMRTGLMMSGTTIVAILTALIFTQSEVIRQIMIILLIGLGIDLINTWIQNAGLLRLYVERKQKPYEEKSGNDVEGEYE
jgi:preprotein translocase subunit SecF